MMALRNPKFVVGSGRRYIETVCTPVDGSVTIAQP
jgi:hypothetical protein